MIKRIVAVILLLVLFSIPVLGGESCPVGSIRVGKARLAEDGTPVYVGIRWNTVLFRIGLPPWIKLGLFTGVSVSGYDRMYFLGGSYEVNRYVDIQYGKAIYQGGDLDDYVGVSFYVAPVF